MTEQRLQEMLNKATDDACAQKDAVRRAVMRHVSERRVKNKKAPAAWIAAAAAIVLVFFMGFTEPGRALTMSIWSLFAPEKPVAVELEGYTEEKTAILAPDSEEHYAFYYDEAQFERCLRDGADVLLAKDQDGRLPEISLTIRLIENTSAQTLYESALTADAIDLGAVESPIVGYGMETRRGQAWNDPVTVLYWLDDGLGNAYEFTLSGFVEAYEGYIQRMRQILTTFVTDSYHNI